MWLDRAVKLIDLALIGDGDRDALEFTSARVAVHRKSRAREHARIPPIRPQAGDPARMSFRRR